MNKKKTIPLDPELQSFLQSQGLPAADANFELLRQLAKQAAGSSEKKPETRLPTRWQDALIESLVAPGDTVLDLGCGNGDLLLRLADNSKARVQGVELDENLLRRCIERGLPVYHGDLEQCLGIFSSDSFSFVILEETVQTLKQPLLVLREMLRVGKQGIVSFPNFAHWQVRLSLSLGGRMPVTPALPYSWYDTPNIHMFTINDFIDWSCLESLDIAAGWCLVGSEVLPYRPEHNISAEQALFVIKKKTG